MMTNRKQLTLKQLSILECLYFDNASIDLTLDNFTQKHLFKLNIQQPEGASNCPNLHNSKVSHQDLTALMNAGALQMTENQQLRATQEVPMILARAGITTEDLYPHFLCPTSVQSFTYSRSAQAA